MSGKVALVFGASGVTGWSVVNEILTNYPKKGIWDKVYALTNRPLSQKDSRWPDDPRLKIVSGVDLLKGSQEDLEKELRDKVEGIETVTHVYYLGKHTYLYQTRLRLRILMHRSIQGLHRLCPRTQGCSGNVETLHNRSR